MYNKIKESISNDMVLFEEKLNSSLRSEVELLDIVVNYINNNRGKRLRPVMMFLVSGLFNRDETLQEQLIDYVVSIETLHQATLVHDDVVDNSKERRGKASINSVWNNKISVLLGDYMFSKGFNVFYKYKDINIMHVMSESMRVMSEGEFLALEMSNTLDQTEESYYKVIYSKTASLIETSCKVAGLIYTDDLELLESLTEYGRNIGMGFQMRDDLFDYINDNKLIGKPVGNDIKEHQITLPLIYALNNSSAMERERILSMLKLSIISDVQIKDIIRFTKIMGGLDYAERKAREFIEKAISCLDVFPDGLAKSRLIDFAKYMVDRKK